MAPLRRLRKGWRAVFRPPREPNETHVGIRNARQQELPHRIAFEFTSVHVRDAKQRRPLSRHTARLLEVNTSLRVNRVVPVADTRQPVGRSAIDACPHGVGHDRVQRNERRVGHGQHSKLGVGIGGQQCFENELCEERVENTLGYQVRKNLLRNPETPELGYIRRPSPQTLWLGSLQQEPLT